MKTRKAAPRDGFWSRVATYRGALSGEGRIIR